MKRRGVLYFTCLILILLSAFAYAGEPTELAKQTTDKVIEILKNKELRKPEKTKERRALMRKVVNERFDFEEMAKRSLARYWTQRTPEERKEFVALYADLLEHTYVKKVESYSDYKVIYSEETTDSDYAVVKTKIIITSKNMDVPVAYKMERKNGRWGVYDVVIEGVSLVNNYRNQFSKIISSGSYEELVRRLKNKQDDGLADGKAR